MNSIDTQLFQIATALAGIFGDDPQPSVDFGNLNKILSNLFPILWLATAIVSTVWMVVRFIQANFSGATGNQDKYEKAKKARKRALFAWLVGCLWPLLFLVAWPIAQAIYDAINPEGPALPPLFDFFGSSSDTVNAVVTNQISSGLKK